MLLGTKVQILRICPPFVQPAQLLAQDLSDLFKSGCRGFWQAGTRPLQALLLQAHMGFDLLERFAHGRLVHPHHRLERQLIMLFEPGLRFRGDWLAFGKQVEHLFHSLVAKPE